MQGLDPRGAGGGLEEEVELVVEDLERGGPGGPGARPGPPELGALGGPGPPHPPQYTLG